MYLNTALKQSLGNGVSNGASNTATALRAAIKALDEDESAPLLEAVTTVFREAMASEKPLEMCVQYIRDNPDEFID